MSWATMLAPVPVAVALAVFYRPIMMLFSLMGPVSALFRWVEGRRRHRRTTLSWTEACAALDRADAEALLFAVAAECERRHSCVTSLPQLLDAVRHQAGIWQRRPADEDFAEVVVGYGDEPWQIDGTVVADNAVLSLVPQTVRLSMGTTVGICGPTAAREAVGRSILIQLASLHGPDDLCISGNADGPDGRQLHGWLRWLPHWRQCADGSDSSSRPGRQQQRVEWETRASPTPDQPCVRVIVGATIDDLGGDCDEVVVVGADTAALVRPAAGSITRIIPVGLSAIRAEDTARRLAGCQLLTGVETPQAACPAIVVPDNETVRDRWDGRGTGRVAAGSLQVPVGHLADGSIFSLDLASDGPHALVAGTTGSGKSEFLRTWICAMALRHPPEDVSFVLIDFKGGGAFDSLRELAHVAAVVTDLDGELAGRALRSLRAELQDRERQVLDATLGGRLVIVVDEFATLAVEQPRFLHGLVDVAERGRSLGVHLVLATQRPSGVVDTRIRANANLRICLRVQTEGESLDVVGVVDAASLDHATPGMALVRIGAGEPREIRIEQLRRQSPSSVAAVRVGPFPRSSPVRAAPTADCDRSEEIVDVVSLAVTASGRKRAVAPWAPPLPPQVVLSDLVPSGGQHDGPLVLGLADLPDARGHRTWAWNPADGPLLVSGGSEVEREATTATLIASAAMSRTRVAVVAPRFDSLGDWPGWVASSDAERLHRTFGSFERHARTGGGDRLLLVINSPALLGEGSDRRMRGTLAEWFERLVSNSGNSAAIAVIAASDREVPLRVSGAVASHLELGCAAQGGAHAGRVDECSTAEGELGSIDRRTGVAVRIARGRPASESTGPDRSAPASFAVPALPSVISESRMAPDVGGVDQESLEQWSVEGLLGTDVAVVSVAGGGRTNVLSVLREAATAAGIRVVDAMVAMIGTDAFDAAASAQSVLLLFDDLERLGPTEIDTLVSFIDSDRAAMVAVACEAGWLRSHHRLARSLGRFRSSVVLSPDPNDGLLVGASAELAVGVQWTPGRAVVRDRSLEHRVQFRLSAMVSGPDVQSLGPARH